MWNYAIFSLLVVCLALAVGEIISNKTRGMFVSLLFVCPLYIAGYLLGFIPRTSPADTGLVAMMGGFGLLVVIANLGTIIELEQFLRGWRTVALCLADIAVTSLIFLALGVPVFGRELSLSAIAPSFGGTVAALIVGEAASAAGRPEIGAFAVLLMTLRAFVGIPAASLCIKKYCSRLLSGAAVPEVKPAPDGKKRFNIRLLPSLPEEYNGRYMKLAKLLAAALAAQLISDATGGALPVSVLALLLGVLLCELGFLERDALAASGMADFFMFGMMVMMPANFSAIPAEAFSEMILPLLFFLLVGTVGLLLGAVLVGRLMHIDLWLAAALGLTAMLGFPVTVIVPQEVIRGMGLPEARERELSELIIPKMLIGGFTTVSVASVVIAGVVAPLIFA